MHKKIALVCAWSFTERIIGNQGTLPWSIPEDLKHFQKITLGGTCIMGKDTYLSIPPEYRPLSRRENIVVSSTLRKEDYPNEDFKIARTIEEAIEMATHENIFFTGGEGIYREGLKFADIIHGTVVKYNGPGDRYFPEIGEDWEIINQGDLNKFLYSEKGAMEYQFLTFQKKSSLAA